MQSRALNHWILSKDAPYLKALPTRNFKCQQASRYVTTIYKVKTGSRKENVKFLFPVFHFFEASLYWKKRPALRMGNMFPSEKAVWS